MEETTRSKQLRTGVVQLTKHESGRLFYILPLFFFLFLCQISAKISRKAAFFSINVLLLLVRTRGQIVASRRCGTADQETGKHDSALLTYIFQYGMLFNLLETKPAWCILNSVLLLVESAEFRPRGMAPSPCGMCKLVSVR
jgi:hypothetical protein